MAAILMLTSTISSTERRVEAIVAKERTGDGYLDEIGNETRMVSLETRPPHYWNVQTS